jgi:hypothetical protein
MPGDRELGSPLHALLPRLPGLRPAATIQGRANEVCSDRVRRLLLPRAPNSHPCLRGGTGASGILLPTGSPHSTPDDSGSSVPVRRTGCADALSGGVPHVGSLRLRQNAGESHDDLATSRATRENGPRITRHSAKLSFGAHTKPRLSLPMLKTVWIVFFSSTTTDARKQLLNQRGRCNGTRTHETAPEER